MWHLDLRWIGALCWSRGRGHYSVPLYVVWMQKSKNECSRNACIILNFYNSCASKAKIPMPQFGWKQTRWYMHNGGTSGLCLRECYCVHSLVGYSGVTATDSECFVWCVCAVIVCNYLLVSCLLCRLRAGRLVCLVLHLLSVLASYLLNNWIFTNLKLHHVREVTCFFE